MRSIARCLLAAAIFGAVAVSGQDSSTGAVEPGPDAVMSSSAAPEPTPTPVVASSSAAPSGVVASSSAPGGPAGVASSSGPNRPVDVFSSTAPASSVGSSGAIVPGGAASSTGTGQLTAGLCDILTTATGLDNRDPNNEVTALGRVINSALVGTQTTSNGVKVTGIFNEPTIRKYFDGSVNYRQNGPVDSPYKNDGAAPDYVTNDNQRNTLQTKLVNFFGQKAYLDCSATDFPVYNPTNHNQQYTQYQVHYNMNITGAEFALFNKQITDSAKWYGASDADINTVTNLLNVFAKNNFPNAQQNEICHTESCPCATGLAGTNCDGQVNAASSFQASFVSLAVVAAAALFAMAL